MRDSRMTDEWIADAVARNPITQINDTSVRTCPVRLTFVDLFEPAKNKNRDNDDGQNKRERYGATLHFPQIANPQIERVLWPMWLAGCRIKFPKHFDANGQPQGLHWPLHDGATKPQYAGYTPGCLFVSVASEYKPSVVDPAMNPIVDRTRVYSGVWAIVCMNTYTYDNRKKGVGFGIQVVMIVADDQVLEGAGPDPSVVMKGVQISAAFNPAAAFAPPGSAPGMPAPGSIVPVSAPALVMPRAAPSFAAPPPPVSPPVWAPPAAPALDYDPVG